MQVERHAGRGGKGRRGKERGTWVRQPIKKQSGRERGWDERRKQEKSENHLKTKEECESTHEKKRTQKNTIVTLNNSVIPSQLTSQFQDPPIRWYHEPRHNYCYNKLLCAGIIHIPCLAGLRNRGNYLESQRIAGEIYQVAEKIKLGREMTGG